ncbi:hypothetical protein [Pseudomonas sp. DSV-1]|uniref:hypothetical protein n=1 Tax=Pseudomonas sp. DSV-1 TaxID=3112250 RepID=UPI002DBFD702|nr:hypothetical protein [Pseudomonas sp. DSV-1]MEC4238531.1 hypothetical protein [Pseudomonas sp. DSV-1]
MGKRKAFTKTDISVPQVEHSIDRQGNVVILPEVIPPTNTVVAFERNTSNSRNFDFAQWYGVGTDAITYACQRQIERFVAGQDGAPSVATVASYCSTGLANFLDYCALQALAFERYVTVNDVHRSLIDGFLVHLSGQGAATTTRKTYYSKTKAVLVALAKRGIIPFVASGDEATFPRNPFPNYNRKVKGETALSKRERQQFAAALRQATKPIWSNGITLTSDLLVYALLVVALHTGRNATPLLEMVRNCLRPHPKDDTVFLVLWKRRGYNTSKVALQVESKAERVVEAMPTVRINVERLIRRVMMLTEALDSEAPDDLKGRVWLYRVQATIAGKVTALTSASLDRSIGRLVSEYDLKDSDGKPLRINISRLRKTFANRIFDLTDGDLATTASALGNTPRVADQNYLAPNENARRNWQFMGEVLVQELLTATIGATYKDSPLGRCGDPVNGQFAPKREGATCMNFMNCLRCEHYAVTAEDLYKLFSFYFRVLTERSRMDKRRWAREYAHIPRLIDHYIVPEGLHRRAFTPAAVDAARECARTQPHPFWSVDLITSLEVFGD